jgi:hypothetical protein
VQNETIVACNILHGWRDIFGTRAGRILPPLPEIPKNKFQTCALETALLASLLSDYAAQLPTVFLVLHPVFGQTLYLKRCLSFLRALATLAFTVPLGTLKSLAVSRMLKPSTALS